MEYVREASVFLTGPSAEWDAETGESFSRDAGVGFSVPERRAANPAQFEKAIAKSKPVSRNVKVMNLRCSEFVSRRRRFKPLNTDIDQRLL
jgi:hypothetical protein